MRYHKSKCIIANTIGGTVVFLLSAAWIGCITHYQLPYYLADSVTVSVGNESALTPSAAPPRHRLVFRKPGDSYVVPKHEPIEIIYDNVDIANGMLVVISREADNSVIIRFQGRYDPVQLSSKCETVILQGVDVLPPIEAINNAALKQQIIITPLSAMIVAVCSGMRCAMVRFNRDVRKLLIGWKNSANVGSNRRV